jgi:hypothetical protein
MNSKLTSRLKIKKERLKSSGSEQQIRKQLKQFVIVPEFAWSYRNKQQKRGVKIQSWDLGNRVMHETDVSSNKYRQNTAMLFF